MIVKPKPVKQLGPPHPPADEEDPPTLGGRPQPRTPEIRWSSDEEDSNSVFDLVETEATPVYKLRPEDKVYKNSAQTAALTGDNGGHVDNASRIFSQIKGQTTVPKTNLQVLPEGINRVLHRVATSRIARKKKTAPLLTYRLCKITLTASFRLRQHTSRKKHITREHQHEREAADFYCPLCERFFPSDHDLEAHNIGSNHRRRVVYLRERNLTHRN